MKALIKKIMILFMWYPLRITIKYLPGRLTYWMGVVGGYILYLIAREKHKIMEKEINLVFPDKDTTTIKTIIKASFINYCLSEIAVLLYPALNNKSIKKLIAIEGLEHLDNALSQGKGVLLFQAHFGAFQMVMPAIGYSGYTMNQISASASIWKQSSSHDVKKIFDIKAEYEYKLPVKHISITSSLRPVFRALKKNEIVGITVDGGGGKKTVAVKFLRRDARFQTGSADLAWTTGAVIVPAFIVTEKGLKYRLIIHPPIKLARNHSKEQNINNILQEFASILEKYVYRYPSHYGYTLYLRRSRALLDAYPFFADYNVSKVSDENNNLKTEGTDYA